MLHRSKLFSKCNRFVSARSWRPYSLFARMVHQVESLLKFPPIAGPKGRLGRWSCIHVTADNAYPDSRDDEHAAAFS